MELNGKLFDYLKRHLDNFQKTTKKGAYLFTCPNIHNHKYKSKSPTATIINGSDKINCFQCHFKGTIYDIVRLLEADKKFLSDEKITEYLINTLKIDVYSELEHYKTYNWSLVPLAKNSKHPIEKDWTNKTHLEKSDWIKWLNNGYNIGIRTGEISKITVVDVDLKESPAPELEPIMNALKDSDTLVQNTPHGLHYIFQYEKGVVQTTNINDLHIDIRNDGGQIVTQPSKIDVSCYHWKNLGDEIKQLPEDIKKMLLENGKTKKPEERQSNIIKPTKEEIAKINEGGRNELLVSLGGVLINKLDSPQTEFVLNLINQKFMNPPLPNFEINAMLGSLESYKETEEVTQERAIYEYLKLMQTDVTAKDIMENTGLKRANIDKYLSKFVKEGKAIRLSRGRYKYREKVEWSDKFTSIDNLYTHEIPYFDEAMYFACGDIILIGGKPKHGKTTMALNFIKKMVDQNVKPFYIYSESGSRHQKIAKQLNLKEGSFYHSFHANPLSIEIEPNSFTVLDWLLISEKENSDTIFKFFAEEMQRKGGILVIFMQLKESHDWFAPNLVTQFPAFAARYIFNSDDGRDGHFKVDQLRDPKGHNRSYVILCSYNPETKILSKKVEL